LNAILSIMVSGREERTGGQGKRSKCGPEEGERGDEGMERDEIEEDGKLYMI
jgi:hypothetical protein